MKVVRIYSGDDGESHFEDVDISLEDMGYRTDTAEDGPTALQMVARRSYDVALVDFKMPGMDGAALYREIRRMRPEIVAIMVTAYASHENAIEAMKGLHSLLLYLSNIYLIDIHVHS